MFSMKPTTAKVKIDAITSVSCQGGAGAAAGGQPFPLASSRLSSHDASLVDEGILASSVYPFSLDTRGSV